MNFANEAEFKPLKEHLWAGYRQNIFANGFFFCGTFDSLSKMDQTEDFYEGINSSWDHVFDMASVTKALVTVPLWALFCEKIKQFISCEGLEPKVGASCEKLLFHESKLSSWRSLWLEFLSTSNLEIYKKEISELGQTTKAWEYSDRGFWLLGVLLEKATHLSFAELFLILKKELITTNAQEVFMGKKNSKYSSTISTSFCRVRNQWLTGTIHDENSGIADLFLRKDLGHCGLFMSPRGLRQWVNHLLNKPNFQELRQRLSSNLNPSTEFNFGWMRKKLGDHDLVGHWGFTGTGILFDFKREYFLFLLTNRVKFNRLNPKYISFRDTCILEMLKGLDAKHNA